MATPKAVRNFVEHAELRRIEARCETIVAKKLHRSDALAYRERKKMAEAILAVLSLRYTSQQVVFPANDEDEYWTRTSLIEQAVYSALKEF